MKGCNVLEPLSYLSAGLDRWKDAELLFQTKTQLVGACYLAGYAAECILKYVIMKHAGVKDYSTLQTQVMPLTTQEENDLINGASIQLFGVVYHNIADLQNAKTQYSAITKHNIGALLDLANFCNALTLTKTTVRNTSPYCLKWNSLWRYGLFYIPNELSTEEKSQEFFDQIKWLVSEIRKETNNAWIQL